MLVFYCACLIILYHVVPFEDAPSIALFYEVYNTSVWPGHQLQYFEVTHYKSKIGAGSNAK